MSSKRVVLWLALTYLAIMWVWVVLSGPAVLRLFPTASPENVKLFATIAFVLVSAGMFYAAIAYQAWSLRMEAASRLRAEKETSRQQAYVGALGQSLAHENSGADLATVLEFICKEVVGTLGVEAATIVLYHPQHATFELAAVYGLQDEFRRDFRSLPAAGFMDLAARTEPVVLAMDDDGLSALPNGDLYRNFGFSRLAYLPISFNSEFIGVLTIMYQENRGELSAQEFGLLKTFGDQASLAVRKGRLQTDVRQALSKLEVLRTGDLAILSSLDLQLTLKIFLQQVITVLQADAVDVLILNPGIQVLEYAASLGFNTGRIKDARVALGDGFAGKIALERRSIYIANIMQERPFTRHELIDGEGLVTYFGIPLAAKGQVQGVLEVYHRLPFHASDEWLSFLETLAGQAAIAIDNSSLFSNLQKTNLDLTIAYDRTLEGWSRALDLRDKETEGHTRRVTDLSLRLAREFNIHDDLLLQMQRGALLHDIGKMGVPDTVLLKPAELSKEEWKIMKLHPVHAFDMLSPISYLRSALDIPYCHHEKWDGSGYPRGLRKDTIPLTARIFSVVDVWDALTSDRPYRNAWPNEKAFQYVREQAGRHFDPQVSDAFLRMMT